jgi:hypothetical protein
MKDPKGLVATLYARAPLFFNVAHPGHVEDNGGAPPRFARTGEVASLVQRRQLYANKNAVAFD